MYLSHITVLIDLHVSSMAAPRLPHIGGGSPTGLCQVGRGQARPGRGWFGRRWGRKGRSDTDFSAQEDQTSGPCTSTNLLAASMPIENHATADAADAVGSWRCRLRPSIECYFRWTCLSRRLVEPPPHVHWTRQARKSNCPQEQIADTKCQAS